MVQMEPEKAHDRIFRALAGSWQINRQIEPGGTFDGTGTFTREADGSLHYQESGTMQFTGGGSNAAQRKYTYRLEDDGIAVYFADGEDNGNLFHRIAFAEGARDFPLKAEARYPCAEDEYHAKYEFRGTEEFFLQYDVSGPTKNYVMRSYYRKVGD